MNTWICDLLEIDIPIFAFSHQRDVVAAVTNAGGFGVLGASSHGPDELEAELAWIDEQVKGKPYGVDLVIPTTFASKGQHLSQDELAAMIPESHRRFVEGIIESSGLDLSQFQNLTQWGSGIQEDVPAQLLDVALRHPIKLIANALGIPPDYMIERAKGEGVPVAALVGAKEHALKQVHAGVDILVVQGTEAGGHCGEVPGLVLIPEIREAVKDVRDVPILAAGGIVTGRQMAAAIALGADGVWTGSVWLTTPESEVPASVQRKMVSATSRDTTRSKGRTGKPSRQLRSPWTEAWDGPDSPGALPMPLQSFASEPYLRRIDTLAEQGDPGALALATYWVGMGVGLIHQVRSSRQVVMDMVEDYIAAVERLDSSIKE